MIRQRSSPQHPCPVCGGTRGCSVTDADLVICRRQSGDVPGFRHRGPARKNPEWHVYAPLGDLPARDPVPGPKPRPKSAAKPAADKPPHDWEAEAALYARDFVDDPVTGSRPRLKLARTLGLPVEVLGLLPLLGVKREDNKGPCWTIPERDGTGKVVGILRRLLKPKPGESDKPTVAGSNRGLTLVTGWRERPGPVFLVEGASDTLAATAAGLSAVGRPSNMSGGEHLATLLADWPADRGIVVVGENDLKPDGRWPGREGADYLAPQLARQLRRPVLVAYPPGGAKDTRAWFTARVAEGVDWTAAGREFVSSLTVDCVVPPVDPFDINATDVVAWPVPRPSDVSADDVAEPVGSEWLAADDSPARPNSSRGADTLPSYSSSSLEEFGRALTTGTDPAPPERAKCRHGRPFLLEGLGRQNGRQKIVRPPCSRWACPDCNVRMRADRKLRYCPVVQASETPVGIYDGPPKDFEGVRTHVARLIGSTPRVCTVRVDEDRLVAVFLDAPETPRLGRVEPITAADLLASAIDSFLVVAGTKRHPFRPINTSRNFVPPDPGPKPPPQWRKVGPNKLAADEIVALLREHLILPYTADWTTLYPAAGGRPVTLMTWAYPPEMPLEEQAEINRAIVTGVIPDRPPGGLASFDSLVEELLAPPDFLPAPGRAYFVELASPPPAASRVEERGPGSPLPPNAVRWRYADEVEWRSPGSAS